MFGSDYIALYCIVRARYHLRWDWKSLQLRALEGDYDDDVTMSGLVLEFNVMVHDDVVIRITMDDGGSFFLYLVYQRAFFFHVMMMIKSSSTVYVTA